MLCFLKNRHMAVTLLYCTSKNILCSGIPRYYKAVIQNYIYITKVIFELRPNRLCFFSFKDFNHQFNSNYLTVRAHILCNPTNEWVLQSQQIVVLL